MADESIFGEDHLHDRYLRKNQALSRAYDIERKDKIREKRAAGELKPVLMACHKCKQERPCLPYKILETGYYEGVVSVSKEVMQLCEECAPKRKKHPSELNPKQIKALLRGARRGRL